MMWTRKELKDKAKISFRANYWKAVFVALVVVAISVWAAGPSAFSNPAAYSTFNSPETYAPDDVNINVDNGKVTVDVDGEDGGSVHIDMDEEEAEELAEVLDEVGSEISSHNTDGYFWPGIALVGLSIGLVMLVFVAIVFALAAFIFNPLEVGCMRFFLRNLNQRAEVKEVAFAYDNNYIESVKTLFLRDIFIILWSLLLIVPGIYKSYEYRMIPYLMADDPTMTKDRAFAESKRMMDGQKWNAFVLDLSFIGWNILSALTLGILGVFYVGPYQAQTNAALYEKLRYGLPAPEPVTQQWQAAPYGTAPAQQTQQWQSAPYEAVPAQPTQQASYGYPVQAAQATQTIPASPYAPAVAQTTQAAQVTETAQSEWGAQAFQGAQPEQETQQSSVEAAPSADAQVATIPIIAPASQPPIPPFAAVGYEPDDEPEEGEEPATDVMSPEISEANADSADDEKPAETNSPEA